MTDPITKLRELAEEIVDYCEASDGACRGTISTGLARDWADTLESAVKDSLTAHGYANRMTLIRIRDAVRNHRSGLDDAESAMSVIAVALAVAPVPDGMALVPRVPTDEMLNAARDWGCETLGKPIGSPAAIGVYRAMIEAAERQETK